jgi:hypothetical protein
MYISNTASHYQFLVFLSWQRLGKLAFLTLALLGNPAKCVNATPSIFSLLLAKPLET